MASFHHSTHLLDDEIFLDDDIADEVLPTVVSSLSFEHIESIVGDGQVKVHTPMVPTAEEDVGVEQDEIEKFPSSLSWSQQHSKIRRPSQMVHQPVMNTINDDNQNEKNHFDDHGDDDNDAPVLGVKRKDTLSDNIDRTRGNTITIGHNNNLYGGSESNTPKETSKVEEITQNEPNQQIEQNNNDEKGESNPTNANNDDNQDISGEIAVIVAPISTNNGVDKTQTPSQQPQRSPPPPVRKPTSDKTTDNVELAIIVSTDTDDQYKKSQKNNPVQTDHVVITPDPVKPSDHSQDAKMKSYYDHPKDPERLIATSLEKSNYINFNQLPSLSNLRLLYHNEAQQLHIYDHNEFPPGIPEHTKGKDGNDITIDTYQKRNISQRLACCPFTIINPQNGHYKWVVLIMAWLSLLIVSLIMSSSLYTRIFQLHFNISRSTASWFPSLQIALFCLSNLFATSVCNVIGAYASLSTALFLTLWGFLIPSLLLNFYAILIIHSILVGIGAGLLQMSALYILSDYFTLVPGDPAIQHKTTPNLQPVHPSTLSSNNNNNINNNNNNNTKEAPNKDDKDDQDDENNENNNKNDNKHPLSISFAVGFALSAFGIGNIVWSPYINYFLDKNVHYKEAFIFTACFVFAFGIIILTFMHQRTYPISSTRALLSQYINEEVDKLAKALPPKTGNLLLSGHTNNNNTDNNDMKSLINKFINKNLSDQIFTIDLFFNPTFCFLFIIGLLGACMFYAPFVHLIPHSEDYGLTSNQSSLLLIIIGIVAFISRIGFSLLVEFIHPLICLIIALILQLTCAILWYYSDSKGMFQATAAFTGLSAAAFVVSMSALPRYIFTRTPYLILPSLSMIYGLSFAPAAILVGPLMGWVRDEYDEYNRFIIALIIIACITIVVAAGCVLSLLYNISRDEIELKIDYDEAMIWKAQQDKEAKFTIAQVLIERELLQSSHKNPNLGGIIEGQEEDEQHHQQQQQQQNQGDDENNNSHDEGNNNKKHRRRRNNKNNNNKKTPVIVEDIPERLTPKQLSQHIEFVLRTRPIIIANYDNVITLPLQQQSDLTDTIWYVHPYGFREVATQYAIALAHISLGQNEKSGYRCLYR